MMKHNITIHQIGYSLQLPLSGDSGSGDKNSNICFEEAATVFRDPQALSIFEDEHSANEDRWLTIGISNAGRQVGKSVIRGEKTAKAEKYSLTGK